MREQRTSEGLREGNNKSVIEKLNEEIRLKESVINSLNLNSAEWKEKYEEVVKENSVLRARLNQYYSQELNLASEKYQREISAYVSNELWLKEQISKLEFRNRELSKENVDLKKMLEDSLGDNRRLGKSLESRSRRNFVKKEKLVCLKSNLNGIRGSLRILGSIVGSEICDLQKSVFVMFNNLGEIAQSEISKLNLDNKRMRASLSARNSEYADLVNKCKEQEGKIKKLEGLVDLARSKADLASSRCTELEIALRNAQSTLNEQVSFEKYKKIEQELQEIKEKLDVVTWKNKEITEIIKKELGVMINNLQVRLEFEGKEVDDPFVAFRLINEEILQLKKLLEGEKNRSAALQMGNLELTAQLTKLYDAQKVFNLTQDTNSDAEIAKLSAELVSCKESLGEKDKKIAYLELRMQKLQQELKISFEKLEKFRTQALQNDQNLTLITQLQYKLKQEVDYNQILKSQLEQLKKTSSPMPPIQKGDPAAFLLQKIEIMKNELENYNPTESKHTQEARSLKTLLDPLQTTTNKLSFTIKILEDDFSCKTCKKLEDTEVCACGHLGCINCNKLCPTCQVPTLNTSIFFRLSRRIRDLRLCETQIKDLLSVI